jgi:Arc/MetJ-type ribon-helix-helix transcriptional regulator
MKSMNIDLPDKVAEGLARLVEAGWFHDEAEAIRVALLEFLSHRSAELQERFQREDIEWALRENRNAQP